MPGRWILPDLPKRIAFLCTVIPSTPRMPSVRTGFLLRPVRPHALKVPFGNPNNHVCYASFAAFSLRKLSPEIPGNHG